MALSSFALILGVVAYIFGFPLIFGDKETISWRKKLLKDETSMRFLGTVFAVLCVLALKRQWHITWDAEGLLVVVAWVGLAKSLLLAWWPDQITTMKGSIEERMLATPTMQTVSGLAMVFFGALFTYLGLVLM